MDFLGIKKKRVACSRLTSSQVVQKHFSLNKRMPPGRKMSIFLWFFIWRLRKKATKRCLSWYPDLESALENWESEIDSEGWHVMGETLPNCQDDCIEPIRVKGRAENNPQWGKYEILKDGVWIDYVT